jgi:tetratricopeptide (TPR) repeat protein
MFSAIGRYTLMAIFVIAAGVCLFYDEHQMAAIAVLMFAFVLWSHFKSSSILMASKFFKDGNYEKAYKLLKEVPNPDRLARNRRGYYEFMMGNISLKNEDYKAAEYHFQISSRFPLGTKNDTSFVLIHLANLALRKKDSVRALAYAEKAKELAGTERTNEIIRKIIKEAKSLEQTI